MTQEDQRPGGAGPRVAVPVIDVGGSHATAATVLLSADAGTGTVTGRHTVALDAAAPAEALLDAIAAPALQVAAAQDGPDRSAGSREWVVAMPGPFEYTAGVGLFDAVGKFDALRGVSVREGLAARLGAASDGIRFVNDAAAYGLGEWAFGATTRVDRQVCITLGTGVGSSFLDRGRIVDEGPDVPPHGWAYLLEHGDRPLEETVSTRAIMRAHTARTGRVSTVKEIAAAAADGDADAAAVLDHAMSALGETLAPWLRSFAANRLTVGGSMVRSWSVLVAALTAGISRGLGGRVPADLEIVPSTLLDDAPVLGAAHWLRGASAPTAPESTDFAASSDSPRSDHP